MNTLRSGFSTLAGAWESYLEFSPVARRITDSRDELKAWPDNPGVLLTRRDARDWRRELRGISGFTGMDALRELKMLEMVRLGFLEYATDATVEEATRSLSNLADFCMGEVVKHLHEKLGSQLGDEGGFFSVLGLGKLGGTELNYSSDVDLIFIYDEDRPLSSGRSSHEVYGRMAQMFLQEMGKATMEGPFYRVDMRLRPEGDRGPLARSVESCENYYAAYGELWERLALLKARYCAGCEECAYEFMQMIQPFCYARDMLPEMLREIAHLKWRTENEIVKDRKDHHVKLGPGGIRDIEFFVQGHQLLSGARQPYLQVANTLKALRALKNLQIIAEETCEMLSEAYRFWRVLEHRVQIVEHRQTHDIPEKQEEQEPIARSMGYESAEQLWEVQMQWRRRVREVYDGFFGNLREKESATSRNFVLPDWSRFEDPKSAERNWISMTEGNADFHISPRALGSFKRLSPDLAARLDEALRPDIALRQFSSFVKVFGSRSLLFESLSSNPKALELLIRLFDCSQYLGDTLLAFPDVFEEVARRGVDDPGSRDYYREQLNAALAVSQEDPSRAARIFKREQMVRIALRWFLKLAPLEALRTEFTNLADACMDCAWSHHGRLPLAVISLGKHGGRDLGFGSDLDVLLVGSAGAGSEELEKAAQGMIRFMSEMTPEGSLFEVDPRLRPHGMGALVHAPESYGAYYSSEAQLWEIQALSKARHSAGDRAVAERFFDAILPVWKRAGQREDLKSSLREMKQKVEEGRCSTGKPELEIKTGAGGLMDIDFIMQYWQMSHGVFEPGTIDLFQIAGEKGFERQVGVLKQGYQMFRRVQAWMRFDQNRSVEHLPKSEKERLIIAKRCGYRDEASFFQALEEQRQAVRAVFDEVFESQAEG